MDPAVSSLIGVGLGGAVSIGGSVLSDRLRGRREASAKDAADARSLRLAVRLVLEELAEASSLLESAARSWSYWPAPRTLPTSTWTEYKAEIASAVDGPLDWRIITSAYDAVNNLNWIVEGRRRSTTTLSAATGVAARTHVLVGDETREKWQRIRMAIGVLEQLIGVQGPASRILRAQEEVERVFWPHGDGNDFDEESARVAEEQEHYEEQRRLAEG